MARSVAPLVVLGLALALGIPALAGGQKLEGNHLVDEDYRFRLRKPAASWRLLDEQQVMNVVPDAVAGALSARGTYGVVIAEPAAGVDLDAEILDGAPHMFRMDWESLDSWLTQVTH